MVLVGRHLQRELADSQPGKEGWKIKVLTGIWDGVGQGWQW